MNLFEHIFRELNRAQVKYLVVGGVAVNLYGYTRFTGDLDILVLLNESNLSKLEGVMKKLGYSERLPVSIMDLGDKNQVKKWLKEKNMKAYTFNPPKNNLLQIDVIIEESLKFESYYKRRKTKSMQRIKIPVVSLDDIIQMKKRAKRDKDVLDLKVLKYLSGL